MSRSANKDTHKEHSVAPSDSQCTSAITDRNGDLAGEDMIPISSDDDSEAETSESELGKFVMRDVPTIPGSGVKVRFQTMVRNWTYLNQTNGPVQGSGNWWNQTISPVLSLESPEPHMNAFEPDHHINNDFDIDSKNSVLDFHFLFTR